MSYIGNPPVVQASRVITELVATAGQTDIYPLGGYTPGDYLDVEINGSALKSTDYTATDGVKITLAVAMAAGDDVRVKAYGNFQVGNAVPANNSVDATKLTNGAVTQAKLAANVAGNGPAFFATKSSGGNQSISANVWTKITFPSESWDTNSNYDVSTSRFQPTVAGYYMIRLAAASTVSAGTQLSIHKNGGFYSGQNFSSDWAQVTTLVYLNGSTDYVEGYAWNSVAFSVYENTGLTQFTAAMVRAA